MNSIDGVLARIREILDRIHEIQATEGRAPGIGPGAIPPASVSPHTSGTGKNDVAAAQSLTASQRTEFQKLLQQALASGMEGLGTAATGGSNTAGLPANGSIGFGSLANLESVLTGSTATGPATSAGNAGALQQYQNELVKALQQLAAQNQEKGRQ